MKIFGQMSLPYPVLVLDNVASLPKTWPKSLIRGYDYPGGIKRNFNQSHPEWDDFINSNAEWQDFIGRTVPVIKMAADTLLGDTRAMDMVKMEFSELPVGGGLLPHPDTPKKALTAVMYFTPDAWHQSWGGEFEVLRHKSRPMDDFTGSNQRWEDVETVMAIPYCRGRTVIMRRTPWSLHGVRPIRCPAGFTRDSVTLNWIIP